MNCSEIPESEAKRRFCLAAAARAQGGGNGSAHRNDMPQDPNDEPAERLLARTRQTQASDTGGAGPRRKPVKGRSARRVKAGGGRGLRAESG
jgi:hypothetical protein